MNHFAVIPARAGSKGVTNKNLRRLGVKSLVEWAVDAAKDAGIFKEIILTSDIETLKEQYHNQTSVRFLERPAQLATDSAEMSDVISDILMLRYIKTEDYVWLLQPTSPFRTKTDFIDIKASLLKTGATSLISVKPCGNDHPDRTYTMKRGELFPLTKTNFKNRQNLLEAYGRNGCFYVFRAGDFRLYRTFFLKPCLAHIMEEWRGQSIDSEADLVRADALWREYGKRFTQGHVHTALRPQDIEKQHEGAHGSGGVETNRTHPGLPKRDGGAPDRGKHGITATRVGTQKNMGPGNDV